MQSSNSFDMKAFYQVLLSLILTVYKVDIELMALRSRYPTENFWKVDIDIKVSVCFCLKASNFFPLKTHVFGRSFTFCTNCL